jgi:hypothetical protein
MDIRNEYTSDPPVLAEYVRLPDELYTGRFDALGNESPEGNLFITVRDTAFIWGVFTRLLNAGQRGDMIFTNAPGTFLVGVSFNQWDPSANEPYIGDALFTLISGERGEGVCRVSGRNAGGADLPAAAGIVIADYASYKRSK